MANSSFIHLKIIHTMNEVEEVLRTAVKDVFGDTYEVTARPDLKEAWPASSGIWKVELPNSGPIEHWNKTHDENYGFLVVFNSVPKHDSQEWEFRHPIQPWCHWAQSRLACTMAQQYGVQLYNEDEHEDPDPEILAHVTYADYLCRNLEKPLSEEDRVWLERCLQEAPRHLRELPASALPRTSNQP